MNGWFGKLLSQGGKEVLLKAVGLSMPIYAMSCFKLPKTIISNLISAMTQYWWSSSENHRKISWVSWDTLCLPKDLGGMGFKDLELFNQALLSKQAWRILSDPTSQVARLMKSRYYYDGNFLQAKIGVRPSFAWRSILFGRELLEKGISRKLGNGEDTRVWLDTWLKDEEGVLRAPWRKCQSFQINLKVSELLDRENRRWDAQKLNLLFYPGDVSLILKLKPAWNSPDFWVWKFNKSGDFSVKSAYWLASQNCNKEVRRLAMIQPSLNGLREKVWRVKTEPKIKNFLWKSLNNALPVEDGLESRGLRGDGLCQMCGLTGESINHVLFSCTFARQVWAMSGIPLPVMGFDACSVFANVHYLMQMEAKTRQRSDITRTWPWIIWNIWKRRNKSLFDGMMLDACETTSLGREEALLWIFAQTCSSELSNAVTSANGSDQFKWKALPEGWVKCNISVYWCKKRLLVGGAWVLRNDCGQVLLHSRRAFSQIHDLEQAKLLVVLWALECLKFHRRSKVIVAITDRALVEAVRRPTEWPAFKEQGEEIIRSLVVLEEWKFIEEKKNSNSGADLIASSVSCNHLRQSYVASGAPDWLDDLFAGEAVS